VKILGLFVSGFVFLSFVLGTLINQPDIPLSINGILTKLSGESAFVLMSLLGATLVPHNFYLHSSIVQVLVPVVFNFSNISIIACFQAYIFCVLLDMFTSCGLLVSKSECYFYLIMIIC